MFFESIEDVENQVRRVDLKTESKIGRRKTQVDFYEFKSVQEIPPSNFTNQFGKDLLNQDVNDLSQLKWVFDGKKVSQEQLTTGMNKTIKEWNIPDNIKEKWLNDKRTEEMFKDELLSIFKVQ